MAAIFDATLAENVVANIDDLVKRGFLVKEPGGGRSTSYALSDRWIRTPGKISLGESGDTDSL
jgi:hypothetical protein